MKNLTEIELRVIRMLLAGDDENLSILRREAEAAEVLSRELTGVGFFTRLSVPAIIDRLSRRQTFKLGDVNGTATNVKNGVGFLLYVTDGVLTALEGYTYDEPWPTELEDLTLWYTGEQDRDLEKIRKTIRDAKTPA